MTEQNVLEMRDISKTFSGVRVLDGVQFQVRKGEVHALMGENGAGKSTLMKILMGQYKPDTGEIFLDGQKVKIDSPATALKMGIAMIYQELSPLDNMSVAENIFLGREPTYGRTPFMAWRELYSSASQLLKKHNINLDPRTKVSQLSLAQKQILEIIKAISYGAKIIIMDEPTSALTEDETRRLFAMIKDLKEKSVSIIYISHHMEEIFEIADRVTVLRDGMYIGTRDINQLTKDSLISMMVGRELKELFPKENIQVGPPVLQVKNLTRNGVFYNISFEVKKGEILGIAGLIGSGRSEVMRAIFGADPIDSGEIILEGKKVSIRSPSEAIRYGIAMVTEDRKELSLILCRSIKENMTLTSLNKLCKGPFCLLPKERQEAMEMMRKLSIKARDINQPVINLSGGNQQKVVLAKWMLTSPKVLILDEPTRGIDVAAKSEIHRLISNLAKEGMAVIMVSSEMPEVMGMSDRILVMKNGRIKGEFLRGKVTQEEILECAVGGENVA